MNNKISQADLMLYLQLLLIILLIYFGNIGGLLKNPVLLIIFAGGIFLFLGSIIHLGKDSYTPHPIPRRSNKLKTDVLYKYTRHPLYSGLIVAGLALALSHQTVETLIVYAAFVFVTNLKADLEEELMSARYEEYKDYKERTKKFIPFVY